MTNAHQFLTAELEHAERQLARVRRLQTTMQAHLEAAGLDEVAVYEKLATHKAYRQLQRDEVVYQQVWLRAHRHLTRLPQPDQAQPKQTQASGVAGSPASALEQTLAALRAQATAAAPKPVPYRKPPAPGPNEKCSCGSNIKYKKCCGSPLRQAA